jgi:uncharacterized membrane protein
MRKAMGNKTVRPLVAPGIVLGIGMGGFLDGIIFHQLLQMHNMLSARYPPDSIVNFEVNMFWDGVFHALTWTATALGICMLWKALKRQDVQLSDRVLCGSLCVGWGLFNLVEGVINHHLLEIHHVRESGDHLVWDISFLLFGAILLGVGAALIRFAGAARTDFNGANSI